MRVISKAVSIPFAPEKPLLLYDGECGFCRLWVMRWQEKAQGMVDFASSQSGRGVIYGFPQHEPLKAVQLIEGEVEILSGAAAVFRLMALRGSISGRAGWWVFQNATLLRTILEWGYRQVADHRSFFSGVTRLLWGGNVCSPRYGIASRVFLRMLALSFAAAFAGLWWQVDGLIGPRGILPAGEFLGRAATVFGDAAWHELPTLFWLTGCGTLALQGLCAVGALLSFGMFLGLLPRWQGALFLLLETLYLSLVNVGQVFMGYQWDALLLEAGFLAVFLAPWPWTCNWPGVFSKTSRWLLVWLLFRLLFSSALVKWNSGDPAWHDLTALNYHFWTQPLPNLGGWLAGHLPPSLLRLMTLGMLVTEFGAPWLLFAPRNLRLLGAGLIAGLQLLITLTGNYGFFNLLAFALCILVIDDLTWPRAIITWMAPDASSAANRAAESQALALMLWRYCTQLIGAIAATGLILLSLVPLPLSWIPKPTPLIAVFDSLSSLHIVNGYGLFAVMTKERKEIIIEGSSTGVTWKAYAFLFKPGNPHCMPPFIPLLMPRLDWQMWFAALGPMEASPWFSGLVLRLLQGEPCVLHLLGENPFKGSAPQFLRARLKEVNFSSLEELRKEGIWWDFQAGGNYFPEVQKRSAQGFAP